MTLQATTIEDDDEERGGPLTTSGAAPEVSDGCGHREAAVRDVLLLLEANQLLQATLATNAALCEASLLALLDGAEPGPVLEGVDVARARLDLTDALAVFERARHRARGTLIAAQFDAGMNMKEIGRRWAISRQLAHRFYREAQRDA